MVDFGEPGTHQVSTITDGITLFLREPLLGPEIKKQCLNFRKSPAFRYGTPAQ